MIYIAVLLTLLSTAYLLLFRGSDTLKSGRGVGRFTFFAILFTTGLDGGLLLLPLLDFKHHLIASRYPEYAFSNPLAIEFGFWGFWNWTVYFVTACYFSLYEPILKLFKKPLVKYTNNAFIVLTCAFSAWLLIGTLKLYLPESVGDNYKIVSMTIVVTTLVLAIWSSSRLYYIKNLSIVSTLLFLMLVYLVLYESLKPTDSVRAEVRLIVDYFPNINRFVFPINNYHEFYLLWWMAWSIMIGQFIARFVGGLKVYELFAALLILPSIPIALWFIVLYASHLNLADLPNYIKYLMAAIGVLFTLNSIDSLVRVYSHNLNLTRVKLGIKKYFVLHFVALMSLTIIYDYRVLSINLVGGAITLLWLAAMAHAVRFHFRKHRSNTEPT